MTRLFLFSTQTFPKYDISYIFLSVLEAYSKADKPLVILSDWFPNQQTLEYICRRLNCPTHLVIDEYQSTNKDYKSHALDCLLNSDVIIYLMPTSDVFVSTNSRALRKVFLPFDMNTLHTSRESLESKYATIFSKLL